MTTRPWTRRGVIAAALLAGAVAAHSPLLAGMARFMTVSTPLERADLVVPLYQDPDAVPAAAAAVLRDGYAPRIALHRRHPGRVEALGLILPRHEVWRRILEARGVPPAAILVVGRDIENDADLAAAITAALGPDRPGRIIVVASAPWSRLASNSLRRAFADTAVDIDMHAVPIAAFNDSTWWKTQSGLVTYFDVYTLWLLRFFR